MHTKRKQTINHAEIVCIRRVWKYLVYENLFVSRGGLAATFDLAAFLVPMIVPVKKSVNYLRTVTSMRITRK